jgi:hypothetical protein
MQRRRAEKILTMLPPGIDSSESSDDDDDSIELNDSIEEICESPLPAEAIANDLDELIRDIELNPIDEVILFTL